MARRWIAALVVVSIVMLGSAAGVIAQPGRAFVNGTKFQGLDSDAQMYYLMGIVDALSTSLSSGVNGARECLEGKFGSSGISISEVRDIIDRHTTVADFRQYTMASIVTTALSEECR
jgi:hypothetical protein